MNLIDYGRKKWDYLLKADFGGANSGTIANGTSIETASSGSVQAGTLTALDSGAGTVSVLSNKLRIDPDSAVSWLVGVTSVESYARANGLALKVRVDMSAGYSNTIIGFHSDNTPLDGGGDGHVFFDGHNDVQLEFYTTQLAPLITGAMDIAIICGGYLSLVPWNGAATGYVEGANVFYKESGNWILKYKRGNYTATPLYFGMRSSQLNPVDIDNIAIPNADLSYLLKPLVLDTFTDTNGTALTAHTPDVDVVGGGWSTGTTGSDIHEIQSNLARGNGTTDRIVSHIDCGKSDVFVEMLGDVSVSFNGSLSLRVVDVSNYWQFDCGTSGCFLRECVSGTFTTRSTGSAASSGNLQRLTAVCNGNSITGYIGDAQKVTYAAATSFNTSTRFGFRSYFQADIDNFAVYPIGTNGEYSDLNRY